MEETKKTRNFREYKVWKDSVSYATQIYKVTSSMPWFEKKGLCDQLQRASVSISSNIAEGAAKPTDADFARFLDNALGSSYEVETQLLISKNVGYINDELYVALLKELIAIEKQLTAFINKVRKPS